MKCPGTWFRRYWTTILPILNQSLIDYNNTTGTYTQYTMCKWLYLIYINFVLSRRSVIWYFLGRCWSPRSASKLSSTNSRKRGGFGRRTAVGKHPPPMLCRRCGPQPKNFRVTFPRMYLIMQILHIKMAPESLQPITSLAVLWKLWVLGTGDDWHLIIFVQLPMPVFTYAIFTSKFRRECGANFEG